MAFNRIPGKSNLLKFLKAGLSEEVINRLK